MKKPKTKYCQRPECLAGNGAHLARECFRDAEAREAREAKRVAAAAKVERRRREKPIDPGDYERCPVCNGLARSVEGGRERHRWPSSPEWCSGGTMPLPNNKKSRGSVRAISSGLPTLGKR